MARLLPTALAALAALAAWLSFGAQSVVDAATSARVGALPPFWLLAVFEGLLIGAVITLRTSARRLWPLALCVFVCLPWLPGRIPPAFLIWYGPMAGLLWLGVIVGLAEPMVRERVSTGWLARTTGSAWMCAALATVAFALGAWSVRARIPAGDEPHYLIITQSLLADGDLQIENNHQHGDYFSYHSTELRPDYIRRGKNGQIYSIHAPGISMLVAPGFALAGWPGAAASIVMLAAFAVFLLWRAIFDLTDGDTAAAWVGASAFAFSAPGYLHAFTIFPDGAAAVSVAAATWALVRLDRGAAVSTRTLALVGTGLAALPWLHTRFALTAGGLGLVLLLRLWPRPDRWRAAAAFLTVPVMSALAWFGFFWVIWGTPNPAAPYGSATQSAWAHLLPGVPGLVADQQFGLVPNAPIYGAALLGLITLARWRRRLALEIAAVFVAYLLAVAAYRMWWGGYSAPARFLVSVLPLLSVPLAAGWMRGSVGRRAVILALLSVGIAMVACRLTVDGGALLYNERDGYDRLLEWSNRSVSLPLAWPSLHRDVVPDAVRDIAIWVVVLGICGAAGAALGSRLGQPWTMACVPLAAAVMLAASLVWPGRAQSIVETTSALDLLRRWHGGPLALGWQSRPFGFVPVDGVLNTLIVRSGGHVPGTTETPSLFLAPMVPAGTYVLHVESGRPQGRLSIRAGDAPADLDELYLERLPNGVVLELPVRVRSLRIQGDDLARVSVGRLALRPVARPPFRDARTASRAVRYQSLRVFFLDDYAFPEPGGFWTVGSAKTDVFLDGGSDGGPQSSPRALTFRAGAAGVGVTLTSGAWETAITLDPGETAHVPLPDPIEGGWPLRIQTRGGFRPAQHAPGNGDWRNLGVWVGPAP